jgi:hypothetical protein
MIKYLTEKQIEEKVYEYARPLKEYDAKNGDFVCLWSADEDQIIGNHWLTENQASGYFIHTLMGGYEIVERLDARNIAEACAAFNTVLQTIKA